MADEDADTIDGCDVEFLDAVATLDEDLPMALGGVMVVHQGDDTDGCDLDFDELEVTADEDLPEATGGVV